jgi:hypothetical protein
VTALRRTNLAAAVCQMLALGLMLALTGCARRSPQGIAQRYIDSLTQFNYADCYHLVTDEDRRVRPLPQFLTEIPLAPDVSPVWFRPILHNMHFTLGTVERNPDGITAFAALRVTMPDLPLWERTLDAASAPDQASAALAERALDTGDFPRVTFDDMIFLAKEHHHWRVVGGFAERDRVIDQHREAIVEYHEHTFDRAAATYESMIASLQRQHGTGSRGLAARYQAELNVILKVRMQLPQSTAYIARVKLSGAAMKMSEERMPAIFGSITNGGGRPLDEVQLAVTWYSGRGKDLHVVKRELHPVVVTPLEFTNFTRPVIPMLAGETRSVGFLLSAPPQVEQEAAPYVTVSSLAFTQSPAPLPKPAKLSARATASPPARPASQSSGGAQINPGSARPSQTPAAQPSSSSTVKH